MLIGELAAEPCRELIERRSILCTRCTDNKKRGDKRTLQMRKVAGAKPAIGGLVR